MTDLCGFGFLGWRKKNPQEAVTVGLLCGAGPSLLRSRCGRARQAMSQRQTRDLLAEGREEKPKE